MANQSLYRRYRPRRFSELKGQDHVVRALRTSVAEGREGQAYLFSGPRGTGKTTSARILAKVLNCQQPVDGEPCCECDSCLSVEKGTSYDVHELDAASNNGVDAMRDLIEKASLGTPGRHKVYILDEVHMLSKGAEAALLKTLEEPPPHVVFVLATTDPQKMSDTIRSRTQHLQFHLLGADTLQEHVRWVASDAGLTVTDEAIEQVVAQGAGSPRDTLSALELIASTGGSAVEMVALDEVIEAMIENDPGRALTTVAKAISLGRDPRTVTEDLVRFMRNGFLSLMAPDLVELPSQRLGALTEVSQRLGPAGLVRGIELLGTALTEMRQAPDPRVLLDVAVVQLTSEQVGTDVAGLALRLQKVERQLAEGVSRGPATPSTAEPAVSPNGQPNRQSGGQSGASDVGQAADPAGRSPVTGMAEASAGRRQLGSRAGAVPGVEGSRVTPDTAAAVGSGPVPAAASLDNTAGGVDAKDALRTGESARPAPGALSAVDWESVRLTLRGMVKAVYSPAVFVSASGGAIVLGLPNDMHRTKCEQHRESLEATLRAHSGGSVRIELVVQGPGGGGRDAVDVVGGGGDDGAGGVGDGGVGNGGGDGGDGEQPADEPPTASAAPAPAPAAPEPTDLVEPNPTERSASSASDVDRTASHLSVVRDDDGVRDEDEADATEPQPEFEPESGSGSEPALSGRAIAERARARGPEPDPEAAFQTHAATLPDDDDEIDLDDLIDAPLEAVKSPIDRLAEAFPGSQLVDETY
jgi:DNA polymerase III subunit gamma/tau